MASKYQLKSNNFYIEGTDIPINKHNINDSKLLHEIEKELLEEAYQLFWDEMNEDTLFDEHYFKELHKRTFESLYEWAGIYRDFNMAKGESRFCQGVFIDSESQKIFDALSDDNYLRDYAHKPKEKFAHKLAYYQCELIALHPFYELNGRITRMFFDMIVAYNGYQFIDYAIEEPHNYIDASIECVQYADSETLERIILQGLFK
ncbi:MAG: Fic family protein [Campylobacterota bacterium]|nr:Fic family protein [Campylobacterota bacterium]